MDIQLLGFPTTLGLPRQANEHGPAALRRAGLIPMLERCGLPVEDLGDLPVEPGLSEDPVPTRMRKVVDAARRQSELWQRVHRPESLMLTLGGDHSTSVGTIWALAAMGRSFDIVWIDAHGDFNIPETSPTGNPHGMVLSLTAGLMPDYLPATLVAPDRLHFWGIRSLDPGERMLLNQSGAVVLTPEQVRQKGESILSRLKPDVYLSFDIDSVDPSEAPGTMTPVPGGFRREEAVALVALLARERNLIALDIVEFHPDRDRESATVDLAMRVAATAISGVVHRAQATTGV